MEFFQNIKVGIRIGILAVLLLAIMISSAMFGINLTDHSNNSLRSVYLDRVEPLKQLKTISDEYAVNIVDTSHKVRSKAITWSSGSKNLEVAQKSISTQLNSFMSTYLVPAEQKLVDDLKPKLLIADAAISDLNRIFNDHNSKGLDLFINTKLYPSIDPVTDVISQLINVQLKVAKAIYENEVKALDRGKFLMICIIIGSVILAFIVTLVIGRSLTSQLGSEPNTLVQIATRIASGDLNAAKELNRDTAKGVSRAILDINDSLSSISTQLEEAVGKIRQGELKFRGDASNLDGFYATIMNNSNKLADSLVAYLDDIANPIICMNNAMESLFMNKAARQSEYMFPNNHIRENCLKHFKNYRDNSGQITSYKETLTEMKLATPPENETDNTTIAYTGAPIIDANGTIVGIFEILVDHTEVVGMQTKIENLAAKASTISEQLASSASDLNIQIDEANNGSQIQSARTSETATAMEEMNATVLEVAKNAGRAAENTSSTREKAVLGADVVEKVAEAIRQVQIQAENLKKDMLLLGEQAEGIGNVIEVISDIADQTNLLALNAAIEAARAGEAGRGFAVVADEVRKLAEKTMTATTEVNDAITAIQTSSKKNILSTETAAETVEQSTDLAAKAGAVLKEIVDYSDDSSEQVQSIATASEEQSAAAEEITKSTEDIDRISQETSAAMDQAAQSVEAVTTRVAELDRLIQAMIS